MTSQNVSVRVSEFIIGGLDLVQRPIAVGVVILIVYVVAVVANIINILFIINDQKLHKPMYLLICNLAVVDIMYTSSASPTMIGVLVAGVKTISYVPCLIQMFAFQLGWVMEMFALAVMAFDRLLAVSCPFHYHSYLTNARTLVLTYFLTTCVDPEYYFNLFAVIMFLMLFLTFIFICLSYVGIIFFVKLSSDNDKKKMSSTCLSHLIVVTCYYFPARNGLNIGSLLGPSIVNPFVYCLRTKEIKYKIINTFKKSSHLNSL
ncbi:hypothetical protein Q5P01_009774 [Channa striata]|uniref:G-protein coupled receptors family 1 profile domain-containing protein n=1 Tax=Channa striata TaxID=64152 RepID=A0AA88SSK9_CHASR|nr:hypothetical protein Q5P01_009774 [Channa striata]